MSLENFSINDDQSNVVIDIEEEKDTLDDLLMPLMKIKERDTKKFGRDMSPETLRKERNKVYSKASRRKKKEYVKILEDKISTLEAKVSELTDQLKTYKNKIFAFAAGYERDYEEANQTKAYYDGEFYDFLEN